MISLILLELHEAQQVLFFLVFGARNGPRRQVEDARDAAEQQLERTHEGRQTQTPCLRVARDQRPRQGLEQGHQHQPRQDHSRDQQPVMPFFQRHDRDGQRRRSEHCQVASQSQRPQQ
jgi:hypothetical protein